MRPSKDLPQSRPYPQARESSVWTQTPTGRVSPSMRVSPGPKQVRYVSVRVPIPVNSPISTDDMMGFYHPSFQSPSPTTVSTTGTNSISTNKSRRISSPFAFVPISNDDLVHTRPFSPPASPFAYGKASPTLSLMSTMTAEVSLSSSTLDRASPAFFPALYRPPTPQDARPRTPTGRKSPYKQDDDDSVRKSRIKTEMCMHYSKGRPCPFGSNCTYAHGEEELQMTKLMDLHKAGLIDVETYRTKPCLTWVTTGSWYVTKIMNYSRVVVFEIFTHGACCCYNS
jgi:hypothetical protein